jgi:hypothetical protein
MVIGVGLAVYADSVSSVITCDGAVWTSSSIIGQTETYAASLFTTDLGTLIRNLQIRDDSSVETKTNVNSSGTLGIDEYSEQVTNSTKNPAECIFVSNKNRTIRQDRIGYTGLMQTGRYDSTRTIDRQTGSKTMINGTGMILSRAESRDENHTENYQSDAAGNMSMIEEIKFGEER